MAGGHAVQRQGAMIADTQLGFMHLGVVGCFLAISFLMGPKPDWLHLWPVSVAVKHWTASTP